MARKIEIDLQADTASFERSIGSAASSVDKLESELKNADSAAGRFDGAMDKTSKSLDNSTGKFRGTADLAGGLGNVLGVEVLGQAEMFATGFADIADGMGTLLAPALTKAKGAFLALNTTMMANPIFLVVAALVALTIGFVIAYKKVSWFRDGVDAAFKWIKGAASSTLGYITDAVKKAAGVLAKVADIITTPYQLAFRAIASLWNNSIGRLSFSIPGWVPGLGGKGFDVPDIPMLADGGTARAGQAHIVGERGPELFVPRMSGTVLPNGVGGTTQIEIKLSGDRELVELMRRSIRTRGGNVQVVLGSA